MRLSLLLNGQRSAGGPISFADVVSSVNKEFASSYSRLSFCRNSSVTGRPDNANPAARKSPRAAASALAISDLKR